MEHPVSNVVIYAWVIISVSALRYAWSRCGSLPIVLRLLASLAAMFGALMACGLVTALLGVM